MLEVFDQLTLKQKTYDMKEINIYVCGPDIRDFININHARVYVFFDTLRRYLEYKKHRVRLAVNVPGNFVIGGIIGSKPMRSTEKLAKEFFSTSNSLNIKRADFYLRIDENMEEIISAIEELERGGYAYRSGNDVYFDTSKRNMFGELLHADAPSDKTGKERHSLDFPLWLECAEKEAGWKSPWGKGVPAQHVGSAVMAKKLLERVDITGGGKELISPHHERTRMVYTALYGGEFSDSYTYVGHTLNGTKAPTDDFTGVKEILRRYSADEIRYFLLSHPYGEDITYSVKGLEECGKKLEKTRKKLEEPGKEDVKTFLEFFQRNMQTDNALRFLETHGNVDMKWAATKILGIDF